MSNADKTPPKKPKLVRDSFTIPKNEFAAIEALKNRAIAMGTSVKKSELLRAGLMALQAMGDADYKAAIAAVPTLKTGRPQAEEAKAEAPKPVKAKPTPAKAPAKAPAKVVTRTARPAKPAVTPPSAAATTVQPARSRRAVAAKKAA